MGRKVDSLPKWFLDLPESSKEAYVSKYPNGGIAELWNGGETPQRKTTITTHVVGEKPDGISQEDWEIAQNIFGTPERPNVNGKRAEAELATLLSNPSGREYMDKAVSEGKGEEALKDLETVEVVGARLDTAVSLAEDVGIKLNEEQKIGLAEVIKEVDSDVSSIKEGQYDSFTVEFESGEEYLVCQDYETVDRLCIEEIERHINDFGKEVPEIQSALIKNVSEGAVESLRESMKESYKDYIKGIEREKSDEPEFDNRLQQELHENGCDTEEEYLEKLCDQDPVDHYIDMVGKAQFVEDGIKYGWFDVEETAKDLNRFVGAGQTLSSYDGEEVELSGGMWAYRTN